MSNETDRDLKQEIIQVSKRMFHEYGYAGTTFQKIADELGITKGAITYHFKNKYLIVSQLIDQFFRSLREFIDSCPENYDNMYRRFCIMYIYAYRSIMKNARSRELFYHKDQMSQWESGKVGTLYHIYESIAQDFHKNCLHEELLMKSFMDLGARKRLYREYTDNPGLLTIDKYCYYHIQLLGLLSKLDELTILENIREAFAFADRNQPPDSGLFD